MQATRPMMPRAWSFAPVIALAAAATLALTLAGCCCKPTSGSGLEGGTKQRGPARWGTGVINAPAFANGAPRRGIVRSAPNLTASEVARLDNGTQVDVVAKEAGGWYRISWSTGNGYIHGDVLRVTQGG